MRRFRFSLARLERLRELRRRQARTRLAQAIVQLRNWQRRAAEEDRRLEHSLHEGLPDGMSGDVRIVKQLATWHDGRRSVIREVRRRESEASEKVVEARTRHTEDAREHRVVRRLHEKRYQRWRTETELEERKFLDEIHLLKMNRERRRSDDQG